MKKLLYTIAILIVALATANVFAQDTSATTDSSDANSMGGAPAQGTMNNNAGTQGQQATPPDQSNSTVTPPDNSTSTTPSY